MGKPYCLLTEAQKVLARAAKKRWRDRNRAKQRALTKAWQQKNRDRINRQYRDRYAANRELYRAKLKAKRERMGEKYRSQIKRWRTKTRSTAEGMLYHRMSQSVRSALLGAKRKCKWESLLGYSVEELKAHLESQFTEGMTWDKFFGGGIHNFTPSAILWAFCRTNRRFEFQKPRSACHQRARRNAFRRAMRVCNPDRSPVGING